jgi:hypothetical protein
MNQFLWGALALSSWVAGLFFLRFWTISRDRLFLFLGVAFWVLMINWVALALSPWGDEGREYIYLLRLMAFIVIIVGVLDKNRRGRDPAQG